MTSYKVVKSRALKRLMENDSTDEFEPPDKLLNLSLSGSTSDFVSSESECSRMQNDLTPHYESDQNMRESCLSENLFLSGKSSLPSTPSPLETMDVDNSMFSILSPQSDDSLSDYDSDDLREIEKNFAENCRLEQDDFKNNETEEPKTFRQKLQQWANDNVNNITRTALNELLKILREHGHSDLPKSAETLLKTQRTNGKVRSMKSKRGTNGSYIYVGVASTLENSTFPEDITFPGDEIRLLINIDGLPLYNKSLIQVWPILVQILHPEHYCEPFLAGIFCGDSKPGDVEEFLDDFVEESIKEFPNGVKVNNKKYKVKISALVCDTPARSHVKCTKSHTGFYSCERCETRGKTVNKKRVFPKMNCKKRTKHSFKKPRTKKQRQHHLPKKKSPLLRIPDFDPVSHVVLDYMHLLCNGCMKILLERWLGQKKKKGKLKIKKRQELVKLLSKLTGSIPKEFQRKTFNGSDVSNWKATQFRFFLLYAGAIILRSVLSKEYYSNFLKLSVASRILCHPTLALTHVHKARKLLRQFFSELPKLYGDDFQVMNFHNTIHLADDVEEMQAPLTVYSAFPFENFLGLIKKLVRTPRNPLQQIVRRLSEIGTSKLITKIPEFSNRVESGERTIHEIDYTSINVKSFHISVNCPNNLVQLTSGDFVKIQRIFCDSHDKNNVFIQGPTIKKKNLFKDPIPSGELGLFVQNSVRISSIIYPTSLIARKAFSITMNETTYLLNLLHE